MDDKDRFILQNQKRGCWFKRDTRYECFGNNYWLSSLDDGHKTSWILVSIDLGDGLLPKGHEMLNIFIINLLGNDTVTK